MPTSTAGSTNYGSGREVLGHSEGDPFDDWVYIEQNLYTPSTADLEESN